MNEIFDFGYQAIGDIDLIAKTVFQLDAWLIDIRLTTRSPVPVWRAQSFASKLGAKYRHIPELGNVNHAYAGALPIKLKDRELGMKKLLELHRITNLVLMCTCPKRQSCHRKAVIYELQVKYAITVHPLSLIDCNALVHQALQLDLIPNL